MHLPGRPTRARPPDLSGRLRLGFSRPMQSDSSLGSGVVWLFTPSPASPCDKNKSPAMIASQTRSTIIHDAPLFALCIKKPHVQPCQVPTYPLPTPNEVYPMRSSSSEGPRLEACRLTISREGHRRHHEASRVRVLRQTDRLSGQSSHHLNQQANRTLPEARAEKLVRYRPRFLADPSGNNGWR